MESRTRKQDNQHDIDTLYKRIYDIHRDQERIHRCTIDIAELRRIDDLDAVCILHTYILTRRDDPGQKHSTHDDRKHDHEAVRHMKFLLRCHS